MMDEILRELTDIGELVFGAITDRPATAYDAQWYAWDQARDGALRAYEAWCAQGGRDAYAVYRAAQDRADAAQSSLSAFMVEGNPFTM
jgi:hypothetical protein